METIVYTCVPRFHLHVSYNEQVTGVKEQFEEHCLRLFLLVVDMETIEFTCVPSFTSMCAILSKFEG